MAEPAPVLYEAAERVATLTLNRPERLNTIVPALIDAFDEARTRSTGAEGAGERVAVMFALVPGIIRSVAGASVTTIEPAGVVDAVTTGLSSLVTTFGLSS